MVSSHLVIKIVEQWIIVEKQMDNNWIEKAQVMLPLNLRQWGYNFFFNYKL